MRRLLAFGLAIGLIGVGMPTALGGGQTDQLALGDWIGGAEAWGSGEAQVDGAPLVWSGRFKSTFEFTVSESSVAGEFDFTTSGFFGGGSMTMDYESEQGIMHAEFNAEPGAGGTISGTRTDILFNSRPMGTVGEARFEGSGQVVTFPIAGDPAHVSIFTTIRYVSCDQAIGDWDPSITAQIQAVGWDAMFKGYWAASPRLPEDQQTEMDQLIDGMEELFEDYADFDASLGFGSQYDPLGADWSELLGLAERAVEITNKIHNLHECDQQALGAETIQEWTTALASLVGNLVIAAADHVAAMDGGQEIVGFPYSQLHHLITSAGGIGAYGAGSVVNAGLAFQVEQALIDLTSQTVAVHLKVSTGELTGPGESCNDFCRNQHYLWAAGAVVTAVTSGWTLTVGGQSYPPSEAPSLLDNPPGGA